MEEPSQKITKEDGRKNNGNEPGSNGGGGRKTFVEKLKLAEVQRAYRVMEADFWVKMANDKVAPRLEAILDDINAPADLLKFAMKEVNDRAFGKPKEFKDVTSDGKALQGAIIQIVEPGYETASDNIQAEQETI